jgi:hypothetical protein
MKKRSPRAHVLQGNYHSLYSTMSRGNQYSPYNVLEFADGAPLDPEEVEKRVKILSKSKGPFPAKLESLLISLKS